MNQICRLKVKELSWMGENDVMYSVFCLGEEIRGMSEHGEGRVSDHDCSWCLINFLRHKGFIP